MKSSADAVSRDWDALKEDARVLLEATVDQAEQKVVEARKRLAAALEDGNGVYARVRSGVIEGARAADQCVRNHPYADIGFGLCAGAVLGTLLNWPRRS